MAAGKAPLPMLDQHGRKEAQVPALPITEPPPVEPSRAFKVPLTFEGDKIELARFDRYELRDGIRQTLASHFQRRRPANSSGRARKTRIEGAATMCSRWPQAGGGLPPTRGPGAAFTGITQPSGSKSNCSNAGFHGRIHSVDPTARAK